MKSSVSVCPLGPHAFGLPSKVKSSVSVCPLGPHAFGLPSVVSCTIARVSPPVSNMFSSKSFIVSALTFGSLIRFGLMFVCGVRSESTFVLALCGFPVDRLLKTIHFALSGLGTHLKIRWP